MTSCHIQRKLRMLTTPKQKGATHFHVYGNDDHLDRCFNCDQESSGLTPNSVLAYVLI